MTPLASWVLLLTAAAACYIFAFAVYANAHPAREDHDA